MLDAGFTPEVSILRLVDLSLKQNFTPSNPQSPSVSILRLVDLSLKQPRAIICKADDPCFNPSFGGFISKTDESVEQEIQPIRFNPSFGGFISKTSTQILNHIKNFGFNPSFGGFISKTWSTLNAVLYS